MHKSTSLIFLTFVIAGCEPAIGACTTSPRPSVTVEVEDQSGTAILDAIVNYSVDGAADMACSNEDDGTYICGREVSGDFVITAMVTGAVPETANVTVGIEDDKCARIAEESTMIVLQLPTD